MARKTKTQSSQDASTLPVSFGPLDHTLFESAPDGILLVDPSGKIVLANPQVEKMFGYPAAELLNQPVEILLPQHLHQSHTKYRERYFAQPEVRPMGSSLDLRGRHKDGSEFSVDIMLRTITLEDQTVAVAVIRDVTARRLAEERLRQSEERFRNIFDHSNDAIMVMDPAADKILVANQKACDLLKYTHEELLTLPVSAIHPQEMPRLHEFIQSVSRRGHGWTDQLTCTTKTGQRIPTEISASLYPQADSPDRTRIIVLIRNILERNLAREALQKSEQKFYKIFRSAPIPISLGRVSDGILLDVNDHFCQISGYQRSEVIGRTVFELNLMENPDQRQQILDCLQKSGSVRDLPVTLRAKNGEPRSLLYSAEIVDVHGEACILASAQDVTERVRAEGELQQSEERFRKAFHASGDGITITTFPEGRFLDVNESFLQLTGYTREEVIGHSALELGMWGNPEERKQLMRALEQHGNVRGVEVAGRTKSGEEPVALISADRITLGNQDCLLMVAKDITDRKQAEEVVRQNAERFQQVIEFLPVAARVVQNGRVVFANAADARLFGYAKPEDIIGTDAFAYIAEVDIPRLRDYSVRRSAGDSTVPARYEAHGKRLDSSEFPFETTVRKIQWAGQPASLAVTEDLTQRKRLNLYESILPVCSVCGKVRDDTGKEHGQGDWSSLEQYVQERSGTSLSHTFCPVCLEEYRRSQGLRSDSHSSDD